MCNSVRTLESIERQFEEPITTVQFEKAGRFTSKEVPIITVFPSSLTLEANSVCSSLLVKVAYGIPFALYAEVGKVKTICPPVLATRLFPLAEGET